MTVEQSKELLLLIKRANTFGKIFYKNENEYEFYSMHKFIMDFAVKVVGGKYYDPKKRFYGYPECLVIDDKILAYYAYEHQFYLWDKPVEK